MRTSVRLSLMALWATLLVTSALAADRSTSAMGTGAEPVVPEGSLIQSPDKSARVLVIDAADDVSESMVRSAVEAAGWSYDYYRGTATASMNLTPYAHVFLCGDGEALTDADVANLAAYANAGGFLHFLGWASTPAFVLSINNRLILNNTSYYPYTTSTAPHLTVTDPYSYLTRGLPTTYTYANINAAGYTLRINDTSAHVAARMPDGTVLAASKKLGEGHFDFWAFSPIFWAYGNAADQAVMYKVVSNMLAGSSLPPVLVLGNVASSVSGTLSELGVSCETAISIAWDTFDLASYRYVFIAEDGGIPTTAAVTALYYYAARGGVVNFCGGSADMTFTNAVNNYLIGVNTADYLWKNSAVTPNLTVTQAGHRLAYGLPATINFSNTYCNYNQLVVTDPSAQVAATNNGGRQALVTRYRGSGKVNLFTHAPDMFSVYANDHAWFRQVIANMVDSGAPVISAITDIPRDQGGQVRLRWNASFQDKSGSVDPVASYIVWRRVATTPTKGLPAGGTWDMVTTVPAVGLASYQTVVPTLADSSISGGMKRTSFCVSAAMADGKTFWYSMPDSGYSKDNLAPSVPAGFARLNVSTLTWGAPVDPDFRYFTIYGSNSSAFNGTATVVGHSIDRTIDVNHLGWKWYYLTATDFAGNESGPASLNGVTAVPGALPPVFALHGATPNPFNPRTEVRFDLPKAARVTLAIYDVAGRLVRTLVADEELAAGAQVRTWDGADETGHAAAAGTYLCRMHADDFTQVRSMTLLK